MEQHLVRPHGGELVDLIVDQERHKDIRLHSRDWISWDLSPRQTLELELLLNGALSPLHGYLKQADVNRVLKDMKLSDGTLWPIPIVLDVSEQFADGIAVGDTIALRDREGVMLAILHLEEVWRPNLSEYVTQLHGSKAGDSLIRLFKAATNPVFLSGSLEGLQFPIHYDFPDLRVTPVDTRRRIGRRGWRRVLSFDTRVPMHRLDVEAVKDAAKRADTNLIIQPSVGETYHEDVDHYTRIRCYREVSRHFPQQTSILGLVPMPVLRAGIRGILFQAIVRKNYGSTHYTFKTSEHSRKLDRLCHPPEKEILEIFEKYAEELSVEYVPYREFVYLRDTDEYVPAEEVDNGNPGSNLTETEVQKRLQEGRELPDWFSYPEVMKELAKTYPSRSKQGVTVFFTGLSGSGKSTIANALLAKLLQLGGRPVTLLDGDIVRKNLSSELGFSKEHRDINIRRIGFVASEITKNRGIALCAPIAPYHNTRQDVRKMIEPLGGFILVHVDTPIEVCEQRDRKGLYAKARAGIIKEFTGISDPYEIPEDAEITIDTTDLTPEEAVHRVLLYMANQGYIDENGFVKT